MPIMVPGHTCSVPWSWMTHRMVLLTICNELIHQPTRGPNCFYLKFSFTSPGDFWSRQRLFLAQTHLVKLTAISNSQAGTPGAATEASCPVGSYSGMFVLDTHKGFLADSLPSGAPLVLSQGGSAACFVPLIKEQHPQILQSARQTDLGSSCGLLNLTAAT